MSTPITEKLDPTNIRLLTDNELDDVSGGSPVALGIGLVVGFALGLAAGTSAGPGRVINGIQKAAAAL